MLEVWFRRLDHINVKRNKILSKMVSGMDLGKLLYNVSSFACEGCNEGKLVRQLFFGDGVCHILKILEIMHSNMCGPMKTMSMVGANYFFTFVNDYSKKYRCTC